MRFSKSTMKNDDTGQSRPASVSRFARLPKGLPYPKYAMTQMAPRLVKVLKTQHQQVML